MGKAPKSFVERNGVDCMISGVELRCHGGAHMQKMLFKVQWGAFHYSTTLSECRGRSSSSSRYAMRKPQQCPRPKEKLPLPSSPACDSTPIPKNPPRLRKASSIVVSLKGGPQQQQAIALLPESLLPQTPTTKAMVVEEKTLRRTNNP